ncbi:amidohydrolase [Leucobacter rhizosphaerae]|uniref:Amidohydrolase n=1 Tax=Leucobacter rhizosphaerae TaxID=2932245 RepID=A0ABY4G028_9MICO|nr:amidohydrolase [Leucobacter rhizosphaerae]UOQ61872.1 amidohydrolase [Leucobacter rhizosphaerae]
MRQGATAASPFDPAAVRADLVLLAGRVRTGLPRDESRSADPVGADVVPTAVAVSGRRIVAVGTREDAAAWDTRDAEVIELGDATVTAGFVDAHVHPLSGAESRHRALMLHDCTTVEQVAERIATFAADRGPDEWIRGFGLSFDMFVGAEVSNAPFERAFGGRPGYLLLFDGHSVIASDRALELAGIDGPRDFGNNSSIEVDADGRPTGYLIESDAEMLVTELYPRMPFAQRVAAVRDKLVEFAASGYTSLHQMNMEAGDLDVLRALETEGELPVRIRVSPIWRATDPWAETLQRMIALQGVGGRRWRVEGVKFMLDGSIDNGSAWLFDADTRGGGLEPYWVPSDTFTRTIHALSESGVPTATHAIGDRAVEFVLDTVASIPNRAPHAARASRVTHRIEHIETIPDHLIPRFAELGVPASMQPIHAFAQRPDGRDMWTTLLGRDSERARHGWRIADLDAAGACVALGSDWPVEEFDARHVFAANVTRRRHGSAAPAVDPHQALPPERTLAALTRNCWDAIDRPGEGMVAVGALADLAVFADDPVTSDPDRFADTAVLLTVVNGRVAHRA